VLFLLEYSRSDTPRTEDGDVSLTDEVINVNIMFVSHAVYSCHLVLSKSPAAANVLSTSWHLLWQTSSASVDMSG